MLQFNLNGKEVRVKTKGDTPLLWVLRDELNLTGTKFGCGMAQCGACTVQINGLPTRSCVTPLSAVIGKSVTTIEHADDAALRATAQAWQDLNVVQCGYCQSGQIMAAAALVREQANPSDEAIDQALSGNLCRCATYQRIRAAVKLAARQHHTNQGA